MAHDNAAHDTPDHAPEHPTWKQYKWVALILTVIPAFEVWAYYVPSLVASPFNPCRAQASAYWPLRSSTTSFMACSKL